MLDINYGLCSSKFAFLPNLNLFVLEDQNEDAFYAIELGWFHLYLEIAFYGGSDE